MLPKLDRLVLLTNEGPSLDKTNEPWRKFDVGWNPRWPIFHERSGSQLRTRRTRGETQENHSNQQDSITRALDPRTQREIHDPRSTKDDTKGNRFFSVRRS